ncbi:melanoma-associated antigen 10-like [Odocoileus virginianus]|uniref:Melanoma-associated antigen 10-like n=1 Tax=Odocoileus virginianus TaxID=9874 RepID=A0A6J0YC21_ODOVR
MSHAPKRRRCMLEEGSEAQSVLAVVEGDTSSSSTCSSSFPLSSSSSSSSSYPLIWSSPEEGLNVIPEPLGASQDPPQGPPQGPPQDPPQGPPQDPSQDPPQGPSQDPSQGPSQSPPSSSLSPTAVASPMSQSEDGPSSQEESPSTSQALPNAESLPRNVIDDRVADLVEFLLLKYRTKELTTKAEMLSVVIKDYQDHFPEIFREASECLQLAFGVDVKEVDPSNDSYAVVTTLGLTCDGMMSEGQTMPKNGILIVILSMIFMEGDCVSEEKVWEVLNVMGVYDGTDHFIYGEPRELITRVLVQEQYFEYRQVPNSDPASYEFLWGPRAHAEICKMTLLEFLAKISGNDPRAFPLWYEQALRQQEERAQSGIATTDDTSAMASESSSAPPCPE